MFLQIKVLNLEKEELIAAAKVSKKKNLTNSIPFLSASTSAPLKIPRGDNLQSTNIRGLYPAGEGASYAGGILSAAVDGIKVAEAVAHSLLAP